MFTEITSDNSGQAALFRFRTTNTWNAQQIFKASGTTTPAAIFQATGNTSTSFAIDANAIVQFQGTEGTASHVVYDAAAASTHVYFRRTNGTYSTRTAIANADVLGSLQWQGYGTSTYGTTVQAQIRASASQAFTDTAKGTSLEFLVTAVGAATNSIGLRLSNGTLLTGHNAEFFGTIFLKNNTSINFESVAAVSESVLSITSANNVQLTSPTASGNITITNRATAGQIQITAGTSTGVVTLAAGGATRLTIASTGFSTFGRGIVSGVATLTDAATISLDASLGNHFRVTLAGNRTMAAPTNPTDGQRIAIEVIQDATGSRTLTLTTGALGFGFGTDIPSITLTTTANLRDFIECVYNATAQRWYVVRFVKGY